MRCAPRPSPRRLPRGRGDRPFELVVSEWVARASPRTRGSSRGGGAGRSRHRGFPADAGIVPVRPARLVEVARLPRGRGDRPVEAAGLAVLASASPRTRGSSRVYARSRWLLLGFPADAGIVPSRRRARTHRDRLPRGRGDRPQTGAFAAEMEAASPRTRGSSRRIVGLHACSVGFPADAGIVREGPCPSRWGRRLPRGRGDRPNAKYPYYGGRGASPRTRGSSRALRPWHGDRLGFPEDAGIVPLS